MAVFTRISDAEMAALLSHYDIGALVSLKEVGQGIENSNYFLTTSQREWVVTVYETLSASELPFFLEITSTLASAGLPVPAAIADSGQRLVHVVANKPVAIFPRFRGDWLRSPDIESCYVVADFVAKMHSVAMPAMLHRPQSRDTPWMDEQHLCLKGLAPLQDLALIEKVLQVLSSVSVELAQCPTCIVHGDLFRDNILFDQGSISGVIDFYHACEDLRLFDLAVAINDWCATDLGDIQWEMARGMLKRYSQVHPLTPIEKSLWGHVMLLAAARFWLSRLVSRYQKGYQSEASQGDITKDPDELRRKILSIAAEFGFNL